MLQTQISETVLLLKERTAWSRAAHSMCPGDLGGTNACNPRSSSGSRSAPGLAGSTASCISECEHLAVLGKLGDVDDPHRDLRCAEHFSNDAHQALASSWTPV